MMKVEGKEDNRKNCDVHAADVAKEVVQDIDPEIDSDTEVMCMIFQATELSKKDFDTFKQLASDNGSSFDPIRRTTSITIPVSSSPTTKTMKTFSRTRTTP